jgi:hypothetical protein
MFQSQDPFMLHVLQIICAIAAVVSATALLPRGKVQKIRVTSGADSR